MKTINSFLFFALLVLAVVGCSRNKDNDVTPANETTKQTTSSSDESNVTSETDDINSTVDNAIQDMGLFREGAPVSTNAPLAWACDTNIRLDRSQANQKQYTLVYTNSICNGRTRNGKIVIKLTSGNTWADVGAILAITYDDFTISKVVSGDLKTININGQHIVTNINGGRIWQATSVRSIVHKIRGSVSVNLDNGGFRTWKTYRARTYTSGNQGITLSIAGDTTINNISNVDVTGSNRFGDTFYSAITTPIVVNAACGFVKPVQGVKNHQINNRNITVTFGLNAQGNAVQGTNCATHYRIQSNNTFANFNVLVAY